MQELQEIDLIVACFEPSVAAMAKSNMEYLRSKYFGMTDYENLLKVVDSKFELISQDGYTDTVFKNDLISLGYTPDMIGIMLQAYEKMRNYTEDELHAVKTALSNVITNEAINKCKRENFSSPIDFVRAIQGFNVDNIQDVDKRIYREFTLFDIDVSKLKTEIVGSALKSSLPMLNSCSPLGGYLDRTLTMVSGKPGSGKSMLLTQEACEFARQGKKVLYLALGDMNEYHFVTRIFAQQYRVSMNKVALTFDTLMLQAKNDPGMAWIPNLKIQCFQPDQISCSNWISFIKSKGFYDEYDVFIADYDSNFSSEEDMYQKGETTYNQLKALSDRPGKWVFIACQPKPNYYSEEILPLESGNESSRKQQIVDNMVTVSFPPTKGGQNHIGIINVPKYRGGMLASTPYLMDRNGRFEEISMALYQWLKMCPDPVTLPGSGCSDISKEVDLNNIPQIKK